MIRRFFCHIHTAHKSTVQKGTITIIQPKEIILNEGIPFCVNCRHCFIEPKENVKEHNNKYVCKKISRLNVVTGEKIYDTCEKQRHAENGSCKPEGKWFSENLWIDV